MSPPHSFVGMVHTIRAHWYRTITYAAARHPVRHPPPPRQEGNITRTEQHPRKHSNIRQQNTTTDLSSTGQYSTTFHHDYPRLALSTKCLTRQPPRQPLPSRVSRKLHRRPVLPHRSRQVLASTQARGRRGPRLRPSSRLTGSTRRRWRRSMPSARAEHEGCPRGTGRVLTVLAVLKC